MLLLKETTRKIHNLLLTSHGAELGHMMECNCKGSWERWVSELSTLSRVLYLRNNEWIGGHWESSNSPYHKS